MAPVRTLPPRRAPPCSGSTSAPIAGRSSNRIDPARQLCLQYHNCTCCPSCWRSSNPQVFGGPSIQQDQSSGAVASAISQLHLLFVLWALLHRGGRSSKHPSESIQQGQCVCIITLALAARPDGVFAPHSPILLRTFHGYDGPALQHGQSSSCPPCCSYVFRLREYLQEAITPCSAAKHAT